MYFAFQKSLFFWVAIVFFTILVSDVATAGSEYEYTWLEKAEVGQKVTKKGFQQKAQISESRRKCKYRYYPNSMVYYDIRREMYFYPEKGNWFIIETLPKNLDARLGDYVIIEMDTDKPYLYSKRHIKQFPRKDSKKVRTTCGRKLFLCWFMSMQLDDRGLQY